MGQGAPDDPASSLADAAGGFGPGSRIAGYRLEERIGPAAWPSSSAPTTSGSAARLP